MDGASGNRPDTRRSRLAIRVERRTAHDFASCCSTDPDKLAHGPDSAATQGMPDDRPLVQWT